MFAKRKTSDSRLKDVSHQIVREFDRLFSKTCDSPRRLRAMGNLRKLLESKVLGTNEFDVAVTRVANAERYLVSEEFEAATYEVCLLFGGLKSHLGVEEGTAIENTGTMDAASSPPLVAVRSVQSLWRPHANV